MFVHQRGDVGATRWSRLLDETTTRPSMSSRRPNELKTERDDDQATRRGSNAQQEDPCFHPDDRRSLVCSSLIFTAFVVFSQMTRRIFKHSKRKTRYFTTFEFIASLQSGRIMTCGTPPKILVGSLKLRFA